MKAWCKFYQIIKRKVSHLSQLSIFLATLSGVLDYAVLQEYMTDFLIRMWVTQPYSSQIPWSHCSLTLHHELSLEVVTSLSLKVVKQRLDNTTCRGNSYMRWEAKTGFIPNLKFFEPLKHCKIKKTISHVWSKIRFEILPRVWFFKCS